MNYIKWTTELELGIPFIDSDHRVLIRLLNQVAACIEANEESTVLGSVISSLADYTVYHFEREERFQEIANHSSLTEHKERHEELAEKVAAYKDAFLTAPQGFSGDDLLTFLSKWLTDHILGDDALLCQDCMGNIEAQAAATRITLDGGYHLNWAAQRILVVEDNPNFQKLLTTVLKAGGVNRIQLTGDPYNALDRLSRAPVDLVLSDVLMDGMTGGDLARQAFTVDPKVKIVFLSGLDEQTARQRTGSISHDAYIEKPITPHTLFQTMAFVLANAAPPASDTKTAQQLETQ